MPLPRNRRRSNVNFPRLRPQPHRAGFSPITYGITLIPRTRISGRFFSLKFVFERDRTEVAKARVDPGAIIKRLDVIEQRSAGDGLRGDAAIPPRLCDYFSNTPAPHEHHHAKARSRRDIADSVRLLFKSRD